MTKRAQLRLGHYLVAPLAAFLGSTLMGCELLYGPPDDATTPAPTTTTTTLPIATVSGDFNTAVNDPADFVSDNDVYAAMVGSIAETSEVAEEQVQVQMQVVSIVMASKALKTSFLKVRRRNDGTVKVTYTISVPERNQQQSTIADAVRRRLRSLTRKRLQNRILARIVARKQRRGLVNPFTVGIATVRSPSVIHPWATTSTTADTSGGGTGIDRTTTVIPPIIKSQEADAHFLLTATFGPTRASLAEMNAMSTYKDWVQAQIALPVGSHRQYYRERIAPRMTVANHLGGPKPVCEQGSRWWGFTFRHNDVGKSVTVQSGQISIDGVHISDIDPSYTHNGLSPPITCTDQEPSYWTSQGKTCPDFGAQYAVRQKCYAESRQDWVDNRYCAQTCFDGGAGWPGDDCSVGWPNLNFVGYICDVRDGVGSWVRMSTTSSCDSDYTTMLNPAIWRSSPAAGTRTSLSFEIIESGIIVIADPAPSCTFGTVLETNAEGPYRFYVHETRMALIDNAPASPAVQSSFRGTLCPTAPRTSINEQTGCKVVPSSEGCSPAAMLNARFTLNASSISKLAAGAGRRVFALRGLRPRASPCDGRSSRWRRLGCSPGPNCTKPTALAEADAEAVREGLLGAAGQGWLRDVEAINCMGVVAGAVVDDGSGKLFEHVHSDEYNVYDFTDVRAAANWTKRAGSELHFPKRRDVSEWDFGVGRWITGLSLLGKLDTTASLEQLHPHFQLHKLFKDFRAGHAKSSSYSVVCGSPFEVTNKPSAGHHMPFHMNERYDSDGYDYDYDGGPYNNLQWYGPEVKRNIMVTKALYGDDQLRQRMAWAISQIVTVSTHDGPANLMTEMYLTFYDIFLRHAFGNYRDIMREMTYSPIMANWLTYINNKGIDHDELFPDENYAREIMQVFSIGLWKLNRDGSRIQDPNGDDLRTYENWNILEFARVFTGLVEQAKRGNIEDNGRTKNLLDPMDMVPIYHDAYPKANLDLGYLGDGYPLCSDLSPLSFLQAGAKFSFLTYPPVTATALSLVAGTPLFTALCGAAAAPCSFQSIVELGATVTCSGAECVSVSPTVIQVADGFYEYVPPTCVHPFFFDTGRIVSAPAGHAIWSTNERYMKCVAPTHVKAGGVACCKGCTDRPNWWLNTNGFSCANVSATHSSVIPNNCRKSSHWSTQKYCAKTCAEQGVGYPENDCSAPVFEYERMCAYNGEKVTYQEAEMRCASRGMDVCPDLHDDASGECPYARESWPPVNFLWTKMRCNVSVLVHPDGRAGVDWERLSKLSKFPVLWKDTAWPVQDSDGVCPGNCTAEEDYCTCEAYPEEVAVFDSVPTKAELLAALKVGAFPPTISCTVNCGGEVEGFDTSGSIDSATVFKCEGRYYKNVELKVKLTAGYEFRNPPVFMLKMEGSKKPAYDEIEAMVNHLFLHENTPTFLAYRLIQRFTSSNPSGDYIYAVQDAFRTGHFNGTMYGGLYGDLAATIAAILLHPEAALRGTQSGLLREPLLKVIHFMRSMEYKGRNNRVVQLRDLINKVGEWPYSSLDVFNFYHPEYHPEGFPDGVVGPEFQIWTLPNIMAYLNGMTSLVRFGVGSCYGGLGWGQPDCLGGAVTFTEAVAGDRDSTVAELGLLLGGGRLSTQEVEALHWEYDHAADGEKLEAVQYASLVTPAFATLGDDGLESSPEVETPPPEAPNATDYRAVVMLYFAGGMDTFQMLVPTNCGLYDEYVAMRREIALLPEHLMGVSATTQNCTSWGINALLPFFHELYSSGELAFVSNIGNLYEPLTAKTYRGQGKRCNGLFSHIDQERAAQTLTCQTATPIYKGAGGRLGDALAQGSQAYRTESFSMFGRAKWSLGYETQPKIVDRRTGNVPLISTKINTALANVTRVKHDNLMRETYRKQLKDALRVNEELGEFFDAATLSTTFEEGDNRLAQQFKQIARLISVREPRKAERDLFYAWQGGFDHHQAIEDGLTDLLPKVDEALRLFVTELKAQGNFDKVTLVMNTDFGRTLSPNSNSGTDHGWAGHTFVLGGSVNGGEIYNKYPETILPGHEMDVNHGRIIPEFPWENIMVPIAEWMGMEAGQIPGVFPNLPNFNTSHHILPRATVFAN